MTYPGFTECLVDQMCELQDEQPDLELALQPSGKFIVRGVVCFSIEHNGHAIKDEYKVEINIPDDYPESPPTVRETGNAIRDNFHKFPKTGNLCLGAPVEVRRIFAQHKTLLGYINRQVIPYLFSYSYLMVYDKLPHGDLAHGATGLLEYYREFFEVHDYIVVMKLLKLLADDFTPPLMKCPCNSGKILQDCHGPYLDELRLYYSPLDFDLELREMIAEAKHTGVRFTERDVMPRKMWKRCEKRRRKKADRSKHNRKP